MEKRGGQRIWTDGKKWGTEKARRQEKHGRDKRTEVEDETENEKSERSDEMERLIRRNDSGKTDRKIDKQKVLLKFVVDKKRNKTSKDKNEEGGDRRP